MLLCVTLGMDSPLRDAPRVLLFLEAARVNLGSRCAGLEVKGLVWIE